MTGRQMFLVDEAVPELRRRALVIDYFAGAGGASCGIKAALGRSPDVAVNHHPHAVEIHTLNHPGTEHVLVDVWDVDPRRHLPPGDVELFWASPDCTHFSRAKGGTPVKKSIRGLAWVVCRVAGKRRPKVIVIENVPEFRTWGPVRKGRPVRSKVGQTFARFVSQLEALGYVVEHQVLNAADHGAPTHRKRLFIIARRDGQPIVWPAPTHGPGRAAPYKTAAECIDWSIPTPSIFGRKRPLAEATQRRIAEGLRRFVLQNPRPFIVPVKTHGGGGNGPRDGEAPLPTITASKRGEFAVVTPHIVQVNHGRDTNRSRGVDEAMPTITSHHGFALVAPYLAPLNSEDGHAAPRVRSLEEPAPTVMASSAKHMLIAPTMVQTGYGERTGQAPRALDLHAPLGTIVATGQKHALVAAWLAKHYGGVVGHVPDRPLGTITAIDHHSVVACHLSKFYGTSVGAPLDAPAPTITGQGGHAALVAAWLVKYYGQGTGQELGEPLHTIVSKARFGLVTLTIEGEEYALVDIGLRMLSPAELARCQGFAPDFRLTGTQAEQVARVGNSVPPPLAQAVVAANLGGAS